MQASCLVESEFGKSVLYLVSKLPVDKKVCNFKLWYSFFVDKIVG